MKRTDQRKPVKVLAAVGISYASGRDILSGIFKFFEDHANWQLHLVQYDREFTPEVVASAREKGFDGIIATFPGAAGTTDALAQAPLPIVLVNVTVHAIAKRRRLTTDIRNDNTAIGRLAAATFLNNGTYASFAYVPMTGEGWDNWQGPEASASPSVPKRSRMHLAKTTTDLSRSFHRCQSRPPYMPRATNARYASSRPPTPPGSPCRSRWRFSALTTTSSSCATPTRRYRAYCRGT